MAAAEDEPVRGNVRRFIQPQPLAAFKDGQLDPRIPEHRAELVKRGLMSSEEQHTEARKGAIKSGSAAMRLTEWKYA